MKLRKILSTLLIPAVLLTGCSKTEGNGSNTNVSASEVLNAVLTEVPITSGVEKDKSDLENYYSGLDMAAVEDAAFSLCGSGAYPDEIAIIKCSSEEGTKKAEEALNNRLEKQKELFSSYTPDEMYKLEGAVIFSQNNYAVFIALSDNEKAKSIVTDKLS